MGAPISNTNAVRHGQRSNRHGLVHAKLGRRFASAYGHANSLRKAVEAQVKERHGGISLVQQAKIQSLLRLERALRALERAIATTPDMAPDGLRPTARIAIQQWTLQRDRLLAELLGNGRGRRLTVGRADGVRTFRASRRPRTHQRGPWRTWGPLPPSQQKASLTIAVEGPR